MEKNDKKITYFYDWDDNGWFILHQQTPYKTNVMHCFQGYPGDSVEPIVKQITDALNQHEENSQLKEANEKLRKVLRKVKRLSAYSRNHDNVMYRHRDIALLLKSKEIESLLKT